MALVIIYYQFLFFFNTVRNVDFSKWGGEANQSIFKTEPLISDRKGSISK